MVLWEADPSRGHVLTLPVTGMAVFPRLKHVIPAALLGRALCPARALPGSGSPQQLLTEATPEPTSVKAHPTNPANTSHCCLCYGVRTFPGKRGSDWNTARSQLGKACLLGIPSLHLTRGEEDDCLAEELLRHRSEVFNICVNKCLCLGEFIFLFPAVSFLFFFLIYLQLLGSFFAFLLGVRHDKLLTSIFNFFFLVLLSVFPSC